MEQFKLVELLRYVVSISMSLGNWELEREDKETVIKNYGTALELISTLLVLKDYNTNDIEKQIEKAEELFTNVKYTYKNKMQNADDLALCVMHLLLATEYNLGQLNIQK